MRWKEITEAPIADFGTYGDMNKEGSFRQQDLRAMSNPKWQAKLHRMFQNTKWPINLYLVNAPNDRTTLGLFGNPNTESSSYRDLSGLNRWSGIKSKTEVEALIGRELQHADVEQAITVVLIENEGDGRIALTPWMVAHRIAHAMVLSHDPHKYGDLTHYVNRIFPAFDNFVNTVNMRMQQNHPEYKEYHDEKRDTRGGSASYHAISKFFGQTKGMQRLESPGEFLVEAFAQHMVQGAFKMNRVDFEGYPRRRPLTKEEWAFINDTARDFYHGSVDSYIERRFPAPQKPRSSYVAFDADGVGVASFGAADRVEHYKSRGLTVKERKPSWQSKQKYAEWEAKVAAVRDMWERLDAEGFMNEPSNRTEIIYAVCDDFEKTLNEIFSAIMARCVGKCLVL